MSVLPRIFLVLIAAVMAGNGYAQLGPEIARLHAERAGERLAALHSLRFEGRIFIAGETTQFVAVAERPNRLRVESFTPQRRAVQAYDGVAPPWISHTDTGAGEPRAMTAADAQDFIANADFDGPLVDFARKGNSVDYAGEEIVEGRRAQKLLLMNGRDEIFFLWVDGETHEVVRRLIYRASKGRRVAVETRFKDFRPVGGVLQPFRVETSADGELLYTMIIDRMEANVEVSPTAFTKP